MKNVGHLGPKSDSVELENALVAYRVVYPAELSPVLSDVR